ncbi:hypothetical protein [Desulfotomaculum copahuensis]|uniref:hypothetical protein n=1 Tax=Desulfotomaculum copahuensis TaxID=1838280 RepID=UPI001247DE0B|nr:hypothetical protein [Desulfotomaculum copahuensis]
MPDEIKEIIEPYEWNVKTREGISKKSELKIKPVPSIALNGELVYASTIPPQEDLIQAIRERSGLE